METALPHRGQYSVAVDRSRATKEANQTGCESECNRYRHYDGQPASPTAGAREDVCRKSTLGPSDEGGESGGPRVRVQSIQAAYVGRLTEMLHRDADHADQPACRCYRWVPSGVDDSIQLLGRNAV